MNEIACVQQFNACIITLGKDNSKASSETAGLFSLRREPSVKPEQEFTDDTLAYLTTGRIPVHLPQLATEMRDSDDDNHPVVDGCYRTMPAHCD